MAPPKEKKKLEPAVLPRKLIFLPKQHELYDDISNTSVKTIIKLTETVRVQSKQAEQELHQERMVYLRKVLDYVKESDWQYEPIDKYIGQF